MNNKVSKFLTSLNIHQLEDLQSLLKEESDLDYIIYEIKIKEMELMDLKNKIHATNKK